VYRRLARWPGIEFKALHGCDFPGTKSVNAADLSGFEHELLPTIRLASSVTQERELAVPLCPTLPAALARERPDVVLADGGSNLVNNALLLAWSLPTRTPVVWWTLGEVRHPGPLSFRQKLFRSAVAAMDRRGAAVLGYSSAALAYFDRQGIPKERQFRAVNCVDTELVEQEIERTRPEVEPLRDRLGLRGRTVLLFVGAFAPYKRIEDLLAVYGRLRPRHPDLRLLLVGDGPHRPALERFAAGCGADDAVFAGRVVEGLAAFFALADLFVLPGLGGLALSEALVHGLPVISSDADGTELDLIEEGRNGYRFARGDQSALEARIGELLADPARRRAMGAHSRRLVDERYNIDAFMENLVASLTWASARGPSAHRRPRRDIVRARPD
jgi:glycosyltransferase involved in cell wall biosynthesis